MDARDKTTNPERRRFLEVCRRYGFATAVLGGTGGFLWNDAALAQTAADEEAKQKAAKHTMIFATEYKNEAYVKYPVMQTQFKANVEALTKNQMYVKLHPGRAIRFEHPLWPLLSSSSVSTHSRGQSSGPPRSYRSIHYPRDRTCLEKPPSLALCERRPD